MSADATNYCRNGRRVECPSAVIVNISTPGSGSDVPPTFSCFIKFTPCLFVSVLQVGDQILEVNGRNFRSIAHDEAVQTLKSSRHMLMTIKDVGRLPHARTVVDETKWISSPKIAESLASAALRLGS